MRHGRAVREVSAGYEVLFAAVNAVVIADTGHHNGCPTITNDAEAVVADLASQISVTGGLVPSYGEDSGGRLDSRRLFYIDSAGQMDELLHDGAGKFLGFGWLGGPR